MVSYAWVADVIGVLLGLIAIAEFWAARRFARAVLGKPPHDSREHARLHTRGPSPAQLTCEGEPPAR